MTEYVQPSPSDEFPDVWGTIVLAGRQWPGRARVTCSRANNWDRPKAQGEHSAEDKIKGTDQAKLVIEIEYWEASHDDEITHDLLPLIEPSPGKEKLKAVSISHAVTLRRKVAEVTIDDISGPVKDDNGLFKYTIQATESRKTTGKNATGTAGGGGSGTGADTVCALLRKSYLGSVLSGTTASNSSVTATGDERTALQQQAAIAFAAATDILAQIKARKCAADGQGPATNPNLTAGERASDP